MAGKPRLGNAAPGGRRSARRPLRAAALGLSLALVIPVVVGCGGGGESRSGATDSMSYDVLVERLAETGTDVRAADESIRQPWSEVPGRRLDLAGETVQVFEYESAGDAEDQADRISPDGTTIGPHRVDWVDPARFYRSGRLLVLYVGRSDRVLEALATVLGPPFAGFTGPEPGEP